MSVGGLPRCVALMVVLAWMLWTYAPRGRALLPVSSRVPRAGRKTGAGDVVRNGRVMGLSGVIAHMSSSVRAGGMISGVLADVDGSGFAGVPLTASRLKRLLMRQRMPGESAAQAEHVAFELAVACAMCERSLHHGNTLQSGSNDQSRKPSAIASVFAETVAVHKTVPGSYVKEQQNHGLLQE